MNGLKEAFDQYKLEVKNLDEASFALGANHILQMIQLLRKVNKGEYVTDELIKTLRRETWEILKNYD